MDREKFRRGLVDVGKVGRKQKHRPSLRCKEIRGGRFTKNSVIEISW